MNCSISGGIPAVASLAALQSARQGTPRGSYCVDPDALKKARQGVPGGEYHIQEGPSRPIGCVADLPVFGGCGVVLTVPCSLCGKSHLGGSCAG